MGRRFARLRFLVLLLLGGGALFGAVAIGRMTAPTPPPAAVLPAETIEVIVIETIEVPVEIRIDVPGPVRIVEKVVWRTNTITVEVPVIREIVKIVERAAELGKLFAFAEVEAFKFEGLDLDDGKLKHGWRGDVVCSIRAETSAPWVEMFRRPFELSESTAVSTIAPEDTGRRWITGVRLGVTSSPGLDLGLSVHKGSRWGFYGGFQYDIDPETFESISFDDDFFSTVSFTADRARVSGGVEFLFGRGKVGRR